VLTHASNYFNHALMCSTGLFMLYVAFSNVSFTRCDNW